MKYILYIATLLTFLLAACGASASQGADGVRPAPDFTLPNALGGDVSLEEYAGQPVLLFFHMAVG